MSPWLQWFLFAAAIFGAWILLDLAVLLAVWAVRRWSVTRPPAEADPAPDWLDELIARELGQITAAIEPGQDWWDRMWAGITAQIDELRNERNEP